MWDRARKLVGFKAFNQTDSVGSPLTYDPSGSATREAQPCTQGIFELANDSVRNCLWSKAFRVDSGADESLHFGVADPGVLSPDELVGEVFALLT